MPSEIVYHPDALREVKEALTYGLENWPERVADLRNELGAKIEFIRADWVHRSPNEYGVLRINLGQRLPYHLIYRLSEERVEILAFSHHRQRPGYWQDRLGSRSQ